MAVIITRKSGNNLFIYLYITDLGRSLKDWLRYNEIQDKSLVSKYRYS